MSKNVLFYDTETTGIDPKNSKIVEIAAYNPETKQSFVSFANPQIKIPKECIAVHGITDDMVSDAPLIDEVLKQFIDFCGENVVLIAHNNDNFDKIILESEASRSSIELPEYLYIDSLKWARKYRPDLPKHSLQFLRSMYNIPANCQHRALDDVIILVEVFKAMTGDLDIDTIISLLNPANNVPVEITSMPFGKHKGVPLKSIPKNYLKWLKEQGAFDKSENLSLKLALEELGLLS